MIIAIKNSVSLVFIGEENAKDENNA